LASRAADFEGTSFLIWEGGYWWFEGFSTEEFLINGGGLIEESTFLEPTEAGCFFSNRVFFFDREGFLFLGEEGAGCSMAGRGSGFCSLVGLGEGFAGG